MMNRGLKKVLITILLTMSLAIVLANVTSGFQNSNIAKADRGKDYLEKNKDNEDTKSDDKKSDDKKSDDSSSDSATGQDSKAREYLEKNKDNDDTESDDDSSSESGDFDENSSDSGSGDDDDKGDKKIKGKDSRWTLFAQIIMGQAIDTKEEEKKEEDKKNWVEKAFDGAISGIIGDGGVQLDIPYTKFSALNKELTKKDVDEYEGGEEGQALASTFATFSQYGYISSLSGNKLATGFKEAIGDFGRMGGGVIAYIALIFYALMNDLLKLVLDGLVALNPYSLLGFDKGKSALPGDNPLSKHLRKLFDAIGLNGELFGTLMELGLIIIVFLFVMKLMLNLAQTRFAEAGKNSYRFIVRLFVIFAGLPLLLVMSASVAKTAKSYVKATHVTDSPAISHLIDSRAMASGLNMSPSALKNSGESPHVSAEENYIDKKYNPAKKSSRNRISTINQEAYKRLYGAEDTKDISFKLVGKWLQGNKFDVNTYMSDLRANADLPGVSNFKDEYAKAKNLSGAKKEALTRRDLESVMWSSTQNTDEDLRKPDHKNYDPTMNIGVVNDASFSTQSVVLMLQSDFDSSSAKFYAYNMAPQGQQANSKNISTIKTEWFEISMPGEGLFGVFGSWVSLIAESLSYVIISSAVIMALISSVFVSAFFKFFKQIWQSLVFGSVHSLLATFLIYLGTIGSILMAVGLPGAITKFVEGLQSVILEISQDNVPSGIIEIVGSTIVLFIAYWMSYGGRVASTGETPVRLLVTFFVSMALEFENRVAELNRQGATSFRAAGEGLRQAGRSKMNTASQSFKAGARESGNSLKGVSKGAMKGATRGAVKGAVVASATGGVGTAGAVAMASKEGLKGAGMGAVKGSKNRKGTEQGLEKALGESGLDKKSLNSAIGDAKDRKSAMKAEGSRRYASQIGKANKEGNMTNDTRRQSMANYQDVRSEEMLNSIDESAYGKDKYKGIVGDSSKAFSKNLTADKDSIDEMTGDQNLYDKTSKNDFKTMSSRASEEAKNHKMPGQNRPTFTQDEIDSLSNAENENDFVDKLHDTNNGMAYAMQTENARNALQNTKYVDENGDVRTDKIQQFQKRTDRKVGNGDVLSKAELKEKSVLDSAFIMGAKEKYRKPSGKFQDKIGVANSSNAGVSPNKQSQNRNNSKATPRSRIKTQPRKKANTVTNARVRRQHRPTPKTRPSTKATPSTKSKSSAKTKPNTRPKAKVKTNAKANTNTNTTSKKFQQRRKSTNSRISEPKVNRVGKNLSDRRK